MISLVRQKNVTYIRILSAAAGVFLLVLGGIGIYDRLYYYYRNQVDAKEYVTTTKQVNINGQTPVYTEVIREKEGKYYIPLSMLINYFGWEASAHRKLMGYTLNLNGKTLYVPLYGGELMVDGEYPSDLDVAYVDGIFYLSTDFIKEVYGCHVWEKQIEGSERTIYVDNYRYEEMDYSWVDENPYICHAMGLIDGHDYTNSLEAFLYNYEKGYRVFEVDLQLTSDGKVAATHSWNKAFLEKHWGIPWEGEAVTLEEFSKIKIMGKYTTLSFYDIAGLMEEYPDMYIVLDLKGNDYDTVMVQYGELVKEANTVNPEILQRVIPQVYSEEMLSQIREVYDWRSVIYTLYEMPLNYSQEGTIQFAAENGIRVVAMSDGKARDLFVHALLDRGIYTYVHTINSEDIEAEYRRSHVYGFYTDELYNDKSGENEKILDD